MENYTTPKQKRNVVQISVFLLPEERKQIVDRADKEKRSISNYCKIKLLEASQ